MSTTSAQIVREELVARQLKLCDGNARSARQIAQELGLSPTGEAVRSFIRSAMAAGMCERSGSVSQLRIDGIVSVVPGYKFKKAK